jgi:hypothetical protein
MAEKLEFVIGAKDAFSRTFGKLSSALPSLKTAAIGTGVAVAGLGTAMFAITKSTATAYDEVRKFSDQLGISTEFISRMQSSAGFAGIEVKTLRKSIQQLTIRTGEAAMGNEMYAEAFRGLGVEIKNTNGTLKTAEELIPEVADGFQNIEDATLRASLASQLFGARGVSMVQVLKDGSEGLAELNKEAERFGLVISEQAANNAAEFNDSFKRVGDALTGLKNSFGEELLPVFTNGFNKLADLIADNRAEIISFAKTTGQNLTTLFIDIIPSAINKTMEVVHGMKVGFNIVKIAFFEFSNVLFTGTSKITEGIVKLQGIFVDFTGIGGEALAKSKEIAGAQEAIIAENERRIAELQQGLNNLMTESVGIDVEGTKERLTEFFDSLTEIHVEAKTREVEQVRNLNEVLAAQQKKTDKKLTEDAKKQAQIRFFTQVELFQNLASVGETFGRTMFEVSRAASVAVATMETYVGAQRVFNVFATTNPALAYASAAAAVIAGLARVEQIRQTSFGAAHGGITNVPAEQTFLLAQGERVLSARQNRDLTDALDNGGMGGNGAVAEQINIEILPNATNVDALLSLSADEWDDIVQTKLLPSLKRLQSLGAVA